LPLQFIISLAELSTNECYHRSLKAKLNAELPMRQNKVDSTTAVLARERLVLETLERELRRYEWEVKNEYSVSNA